jgi:hypothetical protein
VQPSVGKCQESYSVQLSVGASVRRATECSCQWVQVSGEPQRAAASGCKCQESCGVQLSVVKCQESYSVQLSVGASVRRATACSFQWVQVSVELRRAAVSGQVSGELQRAAVSGCRCQESYSVQLSVDASVRRAIACSLSRRTYAAASSLI